MIVSCALSSATGDRAPRHSSLPAGLLCAIIEQDRVALAGAAIQSGCAGDNRLDEGELAGWSIAATSCSRLALVGSVASCCGRRVRDGRCRPDLWIDQQARAIIGWNRRRLRRPWSIGRTDRSHGRAWTCDLLRSRHSGAFAAELSALRFACAFRVTNPGSHDLT